MNVERFAGDSKIMQMFANQMADNATRMKRTQAESLDNAYKQRARDVAATGVSNASAFL